MSPRVTSASAGTGTPGPTLGRKRSLTRRRLLGWYDRVRRDLPWRRTTDPYAIWVSEIMLQQTRVATVIPYWERFLERFPDVATLAAASEEEVLARWSGLGYYRRARGLHAGAQAVVEHHGGRLPENACALRELPGIGRYTAGAIASIAFGQAEPILDGNVRRVLSRLLAFDATALTRGAEDAELWGVATELVRGSRPGDLNQALMELGATVCTARAPGCGDCPLRTNCLGLAAGNPEAFPVPREKPATRKATVAVAWITRGTRVLLERPPAGSPLRGSWDLPATELEGDPARPDLPAREASTALGDSLATRYGLRVRTVDSGQRLLHGILQRRLELLVCTGRVLRGSIRGHDRLRWVEIDRLGETAVSGATLKVLRAAPTSKPAT